MPTPGVRKRDESAENGKAGKGVTAGEHVGFQWPFRTAEIGCEGRQIRYLQSEQRSTSMRSHRNAYGHPRESELENEQARDDRE
jgi:hypothetical protein